MKRNLSSLFGGLILILLGGFLLALEMGYFQDLTEQTWMLIFAGISMLFWVAYFVSGVRKWGWLFPAGLFAALAGTMLIVETSIADEWIATLILGSIAAPFVVGYLLDRSRWGLLIPAFVLGFIALVAPLSMFISGEWVGALVVGMIGLPFLAAYLATPRAWWALFPAGILLSIALLIALTSLPLGFDTGTLAAGLMFSGWTLTFGWAWLHRDRYPTDWARYPAVVMAILAFILFTVAAGLDNFWPLGLILTGLVMVLLSLRTRREQLDRA